MSFAEKIAREKGIVIPDETMASSAAVSAWIASNLGTERGKGGGKTANANKPPRSIRPKRRPQKTHGSAPSAASTTLKVEASNGLADWTATSTFRPERPTLSQGDRRFESAFLRQRVSFTGAFRGYRRVKAQLWPATALPSSAPELIRLRVEQYPEILGQCCYTKN